MKTKLLLFTIAIVYGKTYAQVDFDTHEVTETTNGAKSVSTTDIDGDGDMDVVVASQKVIWYENTDGQGNFSSQKLITADGSSSVHASDVDGDGDIDVLYSVYGGIAWQENLDGLGNFGPQQIISTINGNTSISAYATDIDGDGDVDVVAAASHYDELTSVFTNTVMWYENTDGLENFGPQQTISTNTDGAISVYAADLDGDGDIDVLSASENDDKIAWYENTDGLGNFGTQEVITTSADGASSVYAVDIDGDSDIDVLSASKTSDQIKWYENTDGLGNFGNQQLITYYANGASSVYAIDIDADGDIDVLSASENDNKIAWYENTDGLGDFGPQQTISTDATSASSVYAADIDGDGDMDALSTSSFDNKIAWYENTDGQGNFGQQLLISNNVFFPLSVFVTDLDGDGDKDIISASGGEEKVVWYENTDGQGDFGIQQNITTNTTGNNTTESVFAIDLDGDGDMDVLSASGTNHQINWYENIDGQGSFGSQQTITTEVNVSSWVHAADLDGDGDADVLSASLHDNKIAWYENTDGQGNFGTQQIITTNAVYAQSVYAADIDGDGDMDVLSASGTDDKIAWYENTDGQGSFGIQEIITTNADYASLVYPADIDGDGDMDVLSASQQDDRIAWYENTDGLGNFGAQQNISTTADYAVSVYAEDIDGDGDMDVLSASRFDHTIAWYENTDGQGSFSTEQVITPFAAGAQSVFATDIDNDNDIDIISTSVYDDRIVWYENTNNLKLQKKSSSFFTVYPNPTTGLVHIDSELPILKVSLYNDLGQLISSELSENILNISKLRSGFYFLNINDIKGNTETKKIIKR